MNNYIKQLIQQKNRVNIPGFGAFIASSDDKNNILFNQYLNYDDGALSSFVAEKEGISESEAKEKISKYVETLKSELEANNKTTIEGFGSFTRENGILSFTKDANLNAEGIQNEEPQQAENSVVEVDFDNISSIDKQEEKVDVQPEPQPEVKPEVKIEEPLKMSEEQQKPSEESNNAAQSTVNVEVNQYDEPEKKKTWLIVLLIILLFLIGAFVCLFIINKDNCVYRFFCGEEKEEIEVVTPPAPKVEEPKVEEPDTLVVTPASNPLERRYNIIVGSYKEKAPADKRVESLVAKGFTKAFVIYHSDWYMVVIESFDSLVEAEARQEEIVDNYRIESWITNSGE